MGIELVSGFQPGGMGGSSLLQQLSGSGGAGAFGKPASGIGQGGALSGYMQQAMQQGFATPLNAGGVPSQQGQGRKRRPNQNRPNRPPQGQQNGEPRKGRHHPRRGGKGQRQQQQNRPDQRQSADEDTIAHVDK